MPHDDPILTFHRLWAEARPPERADRAAGGTLPTRAYRWCEAARAASAFGWYVFVPMDFSLLWDGADIWWHCDLLDDWALLSAAQLPDMAARFDAAAPAALRGLSPPFLSALAEPGLVQVWTGMVARTRPGWSLHVRPPANLPLPGGFALYEGIVETDRWVGPLFANLRLTRTGAPVALRAGMPLLQVQALPRIALAEAAQRAVAQGDMAGLGEAEWAALGATLRAAPAPGRYAAAARRRARGCPFAAG
jgi:hypothetical protein